MVVGRGTAKSNSGPHTCGHGVSRCLGTTDARAGVEQPLSVVRGQSDCHGVNHMVVIGMRHHLRETVAAPPRGTAASARNMDCIFAANADTRTGAEQHLVVAHSESCCCGATHMVAGAEVFLGVASGDTTKEKQRIPYVQTEIALPPGGPWTIVLPQGNACGGTPFGKMHTG